MASNPRVRGLKARAARLKARVGRLKVRVRRLNPRVRRLKARVARLFKNIEFHDFTLSIETIVATKQGQLTLYYRVFQ